jgi:hypothetical protein
MQNKSVKHLVLELLEIIGYPQARREQFVTEFEALNHLEAMNNLIPRLPHDIQAKIEEAGADPQKIASYIPQDQYIAELTKVTSDALQDYLKEILSKISDEQKKRIAEVLASYQQ